MIIITGATGRLGRAITGRLLDIRPAEQIGVSVRDAGKAADLADRGVRVREADFDDSAALKHAFQDADQVLIVSGPADPAPHRNAIEAATAVGAKRILYTSHQAANPGSLFGAAKAHAQTEFELREAGVAFTVLRDGFHAASAIAMMGPVTETGRIVVPQDGPVSWTAHADLADAAVVALTDPARLQGITPPLTGSQTLTFADIAGLASDITGREITRVTVSDDEWVQTMCAHGVPEPQARFLLGVFLASRAGEFDIVDPTLARVIGRAPTPFRDVLADALQA